MIYTRDRVVQMQRKMTRAKVHSWRVHPVFNAHTCTLIRLGTYRWWRDRKQGRKVICDSPASQEKEGCAFRERMKEWNDEVDEEIASFGDECIWRHSLGFARTRVRYANTHRGNARNTRIRRRSHRETQLRPILGYKVGETRNGGEWNFEKNSRVLHLSSFTS